MNRQDGLRKEAPGLSDALVGQLAARPLAEVEQILAAMKQARRDALNDELAKRRQREGGQPEARSG